MSIRRALRLSRRPAVSFVVVGLFWGAFAGFVPVLKAGLGASDAVFGLALLGSAAGLVSSMWLAPLADRWLGARGMQAGIVALSLAWLLPALMTGPLAFAASMAVVGLASGLLDVVMNARVSDLEGRHGVPLMNANHAMFSVAYATSALVVGAAREAGIGPWPVFAGVALVCLLLSTAVKMAPETVAEEEMAKGRLPMGIVALCGVIVLIAFYAEATVESWSALHIERTLAGRAAEGAFGPAMLGLTMAVGRFGGQAMAERLRGAALMACAALVAATGAAIAALATGPGMAISGFAVMGLGVSVIGPLGLAEVGARVPGALRTKAISRVAVLGFSGFFFAPVLMGLASEAWGLRVAFLVVCVTILAILPLLAALRRIDKRA